MGFKFSCCPITYLQLCVGASSFVHIGLLKLSLPPVASNIANVLSVICEIKNVVSSILDCTIDIPISSAIFDNLNSNIFNEILILKKGYFQYFFGININPLSAWILS